MAADDRVNLLRERIARFPKAPGVYLMKDTRGRVLYIGKAKDLRSRVGSAFLFPSETWNPPGFEVSQKPLLGGYPLLLASFRLVCLARFRRLRSPPTHNWGGYF